MFLIINVCRVEVQRDFLYFRINLQRNLAFSDGKSPHRLYSISTKLAALCDLELDLQWVVDMIHEDYDTCYYEHNCRV